MPEQDEALVAYCFGALLVYFYVSCILPSVYCYLVVVKYRGSSYVLTPLAITSSSCSNSWSFTEEGLIECMAFAYSRKELACGVFLRTAYFFSDDYLITVLD